MSADSSANTDPRWQKTTVANLERHIQSENYYARIRLRGKLISIRSTVGPLETPALS